MLDQALERFDSDFFKIWKKNADRILKQLDLGLKKITFPPGKKPAEFNQLEALILKAKATKDNKEYAKTIDEIQALLDTLGTTKDLHNYHANNFIFHCRRSFNWLKTARLTENLKYAQAILNPADKPEVRSELGFIQKQMLKRGIKKLNRQVLTNININVARFIEIQVASMPILKINEITTTPALNTQQSLLAKRLGEAKHNQLKSQLPVANAEDATKYLGQQIHGNAFEFYYSQIASLYATLDKVEKIAYDKYPESPAYREKYKKTLLIESGLGDLATPKGRAFLNKTAAHLGFKDAAELHHNFSYLHQEEAFAELKEKKTNFMSFANRQDIFKEDDPLEKIKNTMREEYARVLEKSKKVNLAYNNSAYTTIICYCAIDYGQSVEMLQKKKNIATIVAQDIIDPRQQSENVGYFEKLAMQFAFFAMERLNFKDRMDRFLSAAQHDEQIIYEGRLHESIASIDKHWSRTAAEKKVTEEKKREKLFKEARTLSEEVLIQKYVERVKGYKAILEEKTQPTKNPAIASQITHKMEKTTQDLITFRAAFDTKINAQLAGMSKAELEAYGEAKKTKIAELSQKIQNETVKLENFTKAHPATAKKPSGRLNIFRALRRKIGSKKNKQSKIEKQAQYLKSTVESLKTELEIETRSSQQAIQQQSVLNTYDQQDLPAIKGSVSRLFLEYSTLLQRTEVNKAFIDEDTRALQNYYSQLKALNEVENHLSSALTTLEQKLNSPEQHAQLTQQGHLTTTELLSTLTQVKREITSLQVDNPALLAQFDTVIHTLNQVDKESKKLRQSEILALAKTKCDEILATPNVLERGDPFFQLYTQDKSLIDGLNDENKKIFFDYVKTQFIQTVMTKEDLQDRKTLANAITSMEYLVLNHPNKQNLPLEDQALDTAYKESVDSLKQILLDKYQKIKAQSPDIQRTEIAQLGAELSHFHQQLIDTIQNRAALQRSYDSWLSNPFGLRITPDMIKAADYNIEAHAKQFDFFSEQYIDLLKRYSSSAPQYFLSLPLNSLEDHMTRLRQQIKTLRELNLQPLNESQSHLLSVIITQHEHILSIASENHEQHLEYQAALIKVTLEKLSQDDRQLLRLQDDIRQDFSLNYDFDSAQFEQASDMLATSQSELANLEASYALIQEREAVLLRQGNPLPGFEEIRTDIESKIHRLKQSLEQRMALQNETLSFYAKIRQGSDVDIKPAMEAEQLGRGLIIAIEHSNVNASNLILSHARKISMLDLGVALQKAAKKGDAESVRAILQSRGDLSFTQTDLSLAIKAALEGGNFPIVRDLLLQTRIEFDNALVSMLTAHLPAQTTLSVVDKGWGQMLVDNDGAILEAIRKCYQFQEQLIDSLPPESTEAELAQSLDRINDVKTKMLNPLQNRYFENPERKTLQITKWESQIKKLRKPSEFLAELEEMREEIAVPVSAAVPSPGTFGSMRQRFSQSYPFEQKATSLLDLIKNKSWDILSLQSALIELQDSATESLQDSFFRTLSEAALYSANHDKLEPLQTIFNFLEDSPQKNEIMFNALRQAMDAGHENVVAWLLLRNVPHDKTAAIEEQLKALYEHKKSSPTDIKGTKFNRLALQVLVNVSLPMDKTLIEMMETVSKDTKSTRVSAIQKGNIQRFFADSDGPHLEEIRRSYQFCDYAIAQLQAKLYSTLRSPLDSKLQEKTPQEFNKEDIEALKAQIDQIKLQTQQQKMRILALKQTSVSWLQDHYEFQNKGRLTAHLTQWDEDLDKIVQAYDKEISSDLNHAEKILAQCVEPKEEPSVSKRSMRHP